jgi:hypothetical protein
MLVGREMQAKSNSTLSCLSTTGGSCWSAVKKLGLFSIELGLSDDVRVFEAGKLLQLFGHAHLSRARQRGRRRILKLCWSSAFCPVPLVIVALLTGRVACFTRHSSNTFKGRRGGQYQDFITGRILAGGGL